MSQARGRQSVSGRQLRQNPSNKSMPIIIAIIVGVVVLAVALLAFNATRPVLGERFPDSGSGQANHLQSPTQPLPVPWNSNPPTSGWHWGGGTTNPGIKDSMVEDTITLHNLEHGFVIFHYRADLDSATVEKLKALTLQLQQRNPCIVLEPRPADKLDVPIAATAWTYLLKLNSYDENALTTFFRQHVGTNNPEKICPVGA